MRVLFIGDIVGKPGRRAVREFLPSLISKLKIDLTIANCENAAGGFGITEKVAQELFSYGIEIMTSGNHIWDKKEAVGYIEKEDRILRPLNYPPSVPGRGSIILSVNGLKVAVLNLSGRVFMHHMDCPFRRVDEELEKLKDKASIVLIDFHGEATSEKIAFGYYVDGRVSAVIGTHTHVQTADEQILPGGTAYITDVGMTGPVHSVIGVEVKDIIEKFITQMPKKFNTAKGEAMFSGVIMEIDPASAKAKSIKRLLLKTGAGR
jgi:hypothetical protein